MEKALCNEISRLELVIMCCVWEKEKERKVSCAVIMDMIEEKYGRKYADTTIYTILSNLAKKDYIEIKQNRPKTYHSKVSKEDYIDSFFRYHGELFFGSYSGMLQWLNTDRITG